MRKIIFLDIDGVLNCISSKSSCNGVIGIDNNKVKLLSKIVEGSGAKIVLISSWKDGWDRRDEYQNEFGRYLTQKLKRKNIYIFDKTVDNGKNRGQGIWNWLKDKGVLSWIVLDDEIFPDYDNYDVTNHLIQTSFYQENGGIQQEHVEKAIEILNREY